MAIKSILILNHSGFDSDSHKHTQSMVLHSYVLPAKRLWSWGNFFFSDGALQHTELTTPTTWSDRPRGTQCEQIWVTPIRKLKNSFYLSDNTRDHFTTFTELFIQVFTLPHLESAWPLTKLSFFFRESCHHRFATMSAIAGNSHYSPVIGRIKQTLISSSG